MTLTGRVRRWRASDRGKHAPIFGAPFVPVSPDEPILEGDAILVVPQALDDRQSPQALVRLLPAPDQTRGAFVAIAPQVHAGLFGRVFGDRTIPRAVRGAALLLRGYRTIEGAVDGATHLDLVWGIA